MFKKATLALTLSLATATTAIASPYFDPEDAVKYRQALYQVISAQMSVMGPMVRGDHAFDGAEIHQRAQNIAQAAAWLPETYFPETRGVSDSRLRDRAWNNMADLQSKGEDMGVALSRLLEASAEKDFNLAQARPLVGALVQSCRSCHDDYRARR